MVPEDRSKAQFVAGQTTGAAAAPASTGGIPAVGGAGVPAAGISPVTQTGALPAVGAVDQSHMVPAAGGVTPNPSNVVVSDGQRIFNQPAA